MGNWFYTDALAAQQGPVDDETLLRLNRAGEIKAKSLVWQEGMGEWTAFRHVAARLFAGENTDAERVEIGVCAHSGQVYPLREMLPYGEALVGPEHKDDFVRRLMEGAAVGIADATDQAMDYVGFWWRTLSSLLDYMIKMIPSGLCMVPYYIAAVYSGIQGGGEPDSFQSATGMSVLMMIAYGIGMLGNLAISIVYDTWMVGKYQATLGKIIIGAKVVHVDGARLSYKWAFLRWLVKKPLLTLLVWGPSTIGFVLVMVGVTALSSRNGSEPASVVLAMFAGLFIYAALLALCSGVYWMAAFDAEKRALHDRMLGTRVVKK